ncbi:MAG: FAD:protein FMN transferase [Pseudomonadales bacterium]|nr:FAD:protein FMN transferase [Pseudomonadales bacterium]
MDNNKRLLPFATGLLLLGVAFFLLYQRPVSAEFSGSTMGTRYQIKIADLPREIEQTYIENQIFTTLDQVDKLMSTYKPNSDVTRFNRAAIDESVIIDKQTLEVIQLSKLIYTLSNGAFDITVSPIVQLWGFGPEFKQNKLPSANDIQRALDKVGFDKIQITDNPPALEKLQDVEIDLSAIAKGYGVDQVAKLLDTHNIENYLVEVGGEIRVKGTNRAGQRWRIGIETPSVIRSGARQAIAIDNASIATSGDYRNFFEVEGKRYSHTINPLTGKPVEHNLASVTVVSRSCAEADALATAMSVLGPKRGFELAVESKLAAYFLVRENDGYQQLMTDSFRDIVDNQTKPH